MPILSEIFKNEKRIPISKLLLDPNNPRFMQHSSAKVPEARIAEPEVQRKAFDEMHHQRNNFEIGELIDAIKADGFMEVDKIFVEPLGTQFLVIEGNRRATALKTIMIHHAEGKRGFESLPPGLEGRDPTVPCVVVQVSDRAERDKLVRKILGLRHHGSILPWKPLPASFNLYESYMAELCGGDTAKAQVPDNFIYEAPIAKKIAALFCVKLKDVRDKVKMYRTYLQLAQESRDDENVKKPETFSKIEETLAKEELRAYFEFDDSRAVLSETGIERMLDLYFGLRGKDAVILQASAGDSNIRDFAYVISEGKPEDRRRITEEREPASLVRADVKARTSDRKLQTALAMIFDILNKLNFGEIGFEGFAPIELQHLANIEMKLAQLKDAAKPRT